ncbi:MAG: hypothetical protein AAGC45_10590 [Bacteroidota bacterium]
MIFLKKLRPQQSFLILIALLTTNVALAHVKWFSGFDFLDKSKPTEEVTTPIYWLLTALSLVVISLLIVLDNKINDFAISKKFKNWLDGKQKYSKDVIRIAMFTVLFVSWVNNTVLTPELNADNDWISWVQFFIALLLLVKVADAISGFLLIGLYLYCGFQYGFFYMLDYYHFIGIATYLITIGSKNKKIANIGIPALYITLGLALIWLAFEKLYYPTWSKVLLEQNPNFAFGLPHDFFVQAAAFVEIGLGFMLLFGALGRTLAAVITLVFILTATAFGKVEVIGHTSLHAMLIVFILEGTGKFYKTPVERLGTTWKKILIGNLSYLFITLLALFMYSIIDEVQYNIALKDAKRTAVRSQHVSKMVDVSNSHGIPKITLMEILDEKHNMGHNLHVELDNWKFTPKNTGNAYKENQGHIHVYVNGKKHGRMYSNWYFLGDLKKGKNRISITLNGDDHTAFTIGEKMIGAEKEVNVK